MLRLFTTIHVRFEDDLQFQNFNAKAKYQDSIFRRQTVSYPKLATLHRLHPSALESNNSEL